MEYKSTSSNPTVPSNQIPIQQNSGLRKKHRLSRVSLNVAHYNRRRRRMSWKPALTIIKTSESACSHNEPVPKKEVPVNESVKCSSPSSDIKNLMESANISYSEFIQAKKENTILEDVEESKKRDLKIQDDSKTDINLQNEAQLEKHEGDAHVDELGEDSDQDEGYIVLDEASSFSLDADSDENMMEELTKPVVETFIKELTTSSGFSDDLNSAEICTATSSDISFPKCPLEKNNDVNIEEDNVNSSIPKCLTEKIIEINTEKDNANYSFQKCAIEEKIDANTEKDNVINSPEKCPIEKKSNSDTQEANNVNNSIQMCPIEKKSVANTEESDVNISPQKCPIEKKNDTNTEEDSVNSSLPKCLMERKNYANTEEDNVNSSVQKLEKESIGNTQEDNVNSSPQKCPIEKENYANTEVDNVNSSIQKCPLEETSEGNIEKGNNGNSSVQKCSIEKKSGENTQEDNGNNSPHKWPIGEKSDTNIEEDNMNSSLQKCTIEENNLKGSPQNHPTEKRGDSNAEEDNVNISLQKRPIEVENDADSEDKNVQKCPIEEKNDAITEDGNVDTSLQKCPIEKKKYANKEENNMKSSLQKGPIEGKNNSNIEEDNMNSSPQKCPIKKKGDAYIEETNLKTSSSCLEIVANSIACKDIQSTNETTEVVVAEKIKESDLGDVQVSINDEQQEGKLNKGEVKLALNENDASEISVQLIDDKVTLNQSPAANKDNSVEQLNETHESGDKSSSNLNNIHNFDVSEEKLSQSKEVTDFLSPEKSKKQMLIPESEALCDEESKIFDSSKSPIGNIKIELTDITSDPEEEIDCLLEGISDDEGSPVNVKSEPYSPLKGNTNISISSRISFGDGKENELSEIISDPEEEIDSLLEGISSDEGTNDDKMNAGDKNCKITEKIDISSLAGPSSGNKLSQNKACELSEIISDPEEEIDSWLEGISSDEDIEMTSDKNIIKKLISPRKVSEFRIKQEFETCCASKSDEHSKVDTLLEIPCDTKVADFFLKRTPREERAKSEDSEDIDRALEGIDMEDNEKDKIKNATEKLFDEASDDSSIKFGIDIQSVLLDDDDEPVLLEKNDNVLEVQSDKIEFDGSEKKKVVNIIDEDVNKIEGNSNSIDNDGFLKLHEVKSGEVLTLDGSENKIGKEVRSVLHVLCNIVSLQADQVSTFERIAIMESVLNKTVKDPELPVESKLASTIASSSDADGDDKTVSDITISKRCNDDLENTSHDGKRLKLGETFSKFENNLNLFSESSVSVEELKLLSDVEAMHKHENRADAEEMKVDISEEKNPPIAGKDPSVASIAKEVNITNCSIGKVIVHKDGLYLLDANKSSKSDEAVEVEAEPSNDYSSLSNQPTPKFERTDNDNILQNLLSTNISSNLNTENSSRVSLQEKSVKESSEKTSTSEGVKYKQTGLFQNSIFSLDIKKVESDIKDTDKLVTSGKRKAIGEPCSSSDLKSELKIEDGNSSLNGMVNGDLSEETFPKRRKISLKDEEKGNDGYLQVHESDMGRFVRAKVNEYISAQFGDMVAVLEEESALLTKKLSEHQKVTEGLRKKMRNLAMQQKEIFLKCGYDPKLERRTVGVNVKIVPQPDIRARTYSNIQQNIPPPTQANSSVISPMTIQSVPYNARNVMPSTLLGSSTTITPTTATGTAKVPVQLLVTNSALNKGILTFPPTNTVVSSPTPGPSRPPASSVLLMTNSTTTTTTATSSSSSSSQQHQVVDLTDDDVPVQRTNPSNPPPKPGTSMLSSAKGVATSSNMIQMPLMSPVMQLLPPGSTMAGSPTDINAIRIRSPSGLSPATRLAWTMPMLRPVAGNPPRLVNVSSPQGLRQPLQTLFLAPMGAVMTTTGQVATTSRSTPITSTVTSPAGTTTTQSIGPNSQVTLTRCFNRHPAPLPPSPNYLPNPKMKCLPPKPSLKMSKVSTGIVLSWNMNVTSKHAEISSYQLYAYQENAGPVNYLLWKKVGDIKALPLPMACTLTHFVEGHKYHFTVRAVDVHKRAGPFSEATSILLFMRQKSGEPSATPSSSS